MLTHAIINGVIIKYMFLLIYSFGRFWLIDFMLFLSGMQLGNASKKFLVCNLCTWACFQSFYSQSNQFFMDFCLFFLSSCLSSCLWCYWVFCYWAFLLLGIFVIGLLYCTVVYLCLVF